MLVLQRNINTTLFFYSYLPSFYQIFCSYTTQSASDKLFADAEREESDSQSCQKLDALVQQQENWTGEERIQDAVLHSR